MKALNSKYLPNLNIKRNQRWGFDEGPHISTHPCRWGGKTIFSMRGRWGPQLKGRPKIKVKENHSMRHRWGPQKCRIWQRWGSDEGPLWFFNGVTLGIFSTRTVIPMLVDPTQLDTLPSSDLEAMAEPPMEKPAEDRLQIHWETTPWSWNRIPKIIL